MWISQNLERLEHSGIVFRSQALRRRNDEVTDPNLRQPLLVNQQSFVALPQAKPNAEGGQSIDTELQYKHLPGEVAPTFREFEFGHAAQDTFSSISYTHGLLCATRWHLSKLTFQCLLLAEPVSSKIPPKQRVLLRRLAWLGYV